MAASTSSRAVGQAVPGQRLLVVLDDDAVDARLGGLAGAAEADVDARQRLQFQGDVLEDMARIGAVAQSLEEAAPLADAAAVLDHRRQPRSSAGR